MGYIVLGIICLIPLYLIRRKFDKLEKEIYETDKLSDLSIQIAKSNKKLLRMVELSKALHNNKEGFLEYSDLLESELNIHGIEIGKNEN